LNARDGSFGFIPNVHEDFFGANFDDGTFDDLAWGKAHVGLLQGFFHCEHNDLIATPARFGFGRTACYWLSPWGDTPAKSEFRSAIGELITFYFVRELRSSRRELRRLHCLTDLVACPDLSGPTTGQRRLMV